MVHERSRDSEPAGGTGLIVLGMHRSGTSALAGALGLCGAWLGEPEELTSANVENPRGFWERRDVRGICDRLLHGSGADWWKVAGFDESAIPQPCIDEQRIEFQRVVAELDTHAVWAIKEPRLCLLFSILRPILVNPVCIHVYRNPLDVAHSLRARNGFGIAEGLALWEAYNLRALDASAGLRRLSVSYEALVSQPDETLRALLSDLAALGIDELALPGADQVLGFIEPGLRHQQHTVPDTIEFLRPSQKELWSLLQSGDALRSGSAGHLSRVAREHLRDLESRKSSLDQARAKAQSAGSALRRQKELGKTLEAELDTQRSSVKQLTREVDDQKSRADRLEADLQASEAEHQKIAATAAYRRDELDKLATRIKASEQNEAELRARLSAVYASQSWRVTAPLRALSRAAKWVLRRTRNAFRLLFWLVTGQFTRLGDVLLPRYGRYVPRRVKELVPQSVREALTRRVVQASEPRSQRPRALSAAIAPSQVDTERFRAKVLDSTFGQELRLIVDQGAGTRLADVLRKSDDKLAQIVARLKSMPDRPLVSVVMPTHNRSRIIRGAIATVLEQEYSNWELLVCDDDSTDDTETVVSGSFDSRIRYFKLPKQGAAAARNFGLQQARGKIIAYLDSDNFWHPGFLSAVVLALLENPGQSSVYSDFIDFRIDSQGRRKSTSLKQAEFDHERLLQKPFIDLNSFAHRREMYDCFGGFDERLVRRQDYDLILKYTWLRDPLHVRCLTTLYQRNDGLEQITRVERGNNSSVSIINRTVEDYFKHGLPAVGRPVEKVTILSWDLCRNHFSKPFALAEALSSEYDVQLISFRFFEEEIFPPLKDVKPGFETLYLPGVEFPRFFESMRDALAAIRGEVIYVVKPRLPSLGLALLANYTRGIPLILEVNDLETVVGAPTQRDNHREARIDAIDMRSEELLNPYSDLWSQLMHPLAKEVPVLTTHNRGIDREFNSRCLYMRNIKDESVYDPSAYDRDIVRAELGIGAEDRVILFGGLIRKHKGIYQLVELVERLGDPRYKLLFVGSRTTPDQKKLFDKYGDRISFLPPQDRTAMARINYAADLVILWLDPAVAASRYQMPYKATDAFAMGPIVIANDISDFGTLAKQGYLRIVPFADWDGMTALINEVFDDPAEIGAMREASRRLFLRQFSYAAARSNFQLAAHRALAAKPGELPVAATFAKHFNEFYRRSANPDDDFVQIREARSTADHNIAGFRESGKDGSIVLLDVDDIDQLFHEDPAGVAVIMPSIDPNRGVEAARTLLKRSGLETTIFVVHDTCRQGFAKTFNDTAQRLNVGYLCYVAEDAFPGVDWLRIAHDTLERTGKGLLAFNDGKWNGRIAGFGMVRTQWVRKLYDGPVFFPGYRSHKADNELTLLARIMNEFVYEPTATLIEIDPSKAPEDAEGGDERQRDRNLFYARFHSAFGAHFPWRDVAPYKDEYLNRRQLHAGRNDKYEPRDDTIRILDVRRIDEFSLHDPEGIAVVLPCVDPAKGAATARLLVKRAGMPLHVCVVEDTQRLGFIATLNSTAAQLDVKYIVYVAEDAFPGWNWLRTAYECMERTGKGLLAFNCGKWHGRVASFGMVRKDWVKQVYGSGVVLHPAYKAHKADNELTVIARVTDQFVYEPNSVLVENDPAKIFKENVPEDKMTFHRRFRSGFDGILPLERLRPLAESYFVPLQPEPEYAANGDVSMTSLRAEVLAYERTHPRSPELSSILDTLTNAAAQAVERGPASVTEKSTMPPSGRGNDYWHPAPYWWPDPATADGLPYVRRDGERVPGTRLYEPGDEKYDRTRLQRVFDDSLILGLAWYFSGEKHYAKAGAKMVERFFTDPATGMTPHLKYAQVRLGHNENQGTPSGIIEAKDFYFYMDALRLFRNARVLSDSVFERMRTWLSAYLEWLITSDQGRAECLASNNHGTCYDLQVGAIASFLGETRIVYETLERAQTRISRQFAPDGHQSEELKRSTTAHYCCFNLQSWINLAELSSRWGVDLWSYKAPSGAGLTQAALWLLSHMDKPWPYKQVGEFDRERFLPIWFAADEQIPDLSRPGTAPPHIYAVKPIFFPHDGIRPFWNVASYAAATDRKAADRGMPRPVAGVPVAERSGNA